MKTFSKNSSEWIQHGGGRLVMWACVPTETRTTLGHQEAKIRFCEEQQTGSGVFVEQNNVQVEESVTV